MPKVSKNIHTLGTALIIAVDTISGYIQGLLDGPIDEPRRLRTLHQAEVVCVH